MNWLFLKVSSLLCYSNSLSLFFSLYFFRSCSYGVSPPLYSPHQFIPIIYLFFIQPCTQVSVLLSNFSGFLWAVVIESTVQRSSPQYETHRAKSPLSPFLSSHSKENGAKITGSENQKVEFRSRPGRDGMFSSEDKGSAA